jgi:hypothetical protein
MRAGSVTLSGNVNGGDAHVHAFVAHALGRTAAGRNRFTVTLVRQIFRADAQRAAGGAGAGAPSRVFTRVLKRQPCGVLTRVSRY